MAQKTMSVGFGGTSLSAATDGNINAAGLYTSTIQTRYINIPKLMAKLNRKNFRHFDNKGYLLNYAVSIQQTGPSYRSVYSTANDNWVLKNAGRKWHAARMADFAKMGLTVKDIGEYNRTIRPYLNHAHSTGTEVVLLDHDGDAITGGEWTYTSVASPADVDASASAGGGSSHGADRYNLVMTGTHGGATTSSERQFYTHVSMTQSYMQSRRTRDESIGSADPGEHTVQDPNPLLVFMQDSVTGGMKTELLEEIQDEGAPYPGAHSAQSNVLVLQAETETTAEYRRDGAIINAPGGLIEVRSQQNSQSGITIGPRFLIEVIGITRAEG
jgi:hypothetical protein